MDVYLLKTYHFGMKKQGEESEANKHVAAIITKHKDEEYLNLYKACIDAGYYLSILLNFKYSKNYVMLEEIWNMAFVKGRQPLLIKICENMEEAYKEASKIYSPIFLIKDSVLVNTKLEKSYTVFSKESNYWEIISRNFEALDIIETSKVCLSVVTVNYDEYISKKRSVREIIKNLPLVCISFCAFGEYTSPYQLQCIVYAFRKFKKEVPRFGHDIVLIIGGSDNKNDESLSKFKNHVKKLVCYLKLQGCVYFAGNLSKSDKQAILRLSYAMIYLNSSEEPNSDLFLAMQVGTPIIALDRGFTSDIITENCTGFLLKQPYTSAIAKAMNILIKPHKYDTFSNNCRFMYLLEYSEWAKTIQDFEKEDYGTYSQFCSEENSLEGSPRDWFEEEDTFYEEESDIFLKYVDEETVKSSFNKLDEFSKENEQSNLISEEAVKHEDLESEKFTASTIHQEKVYNPDLKTNRNEQPKDVERMTKSKRKNFRAMEICPTIQEELEDNVDIEAEEEKFAEHTDEKKKYRRQHLHRNSFDS